MRLTRSALVATFSCVLLVQTATACKQAEGEEDDEEKSDGGAPETPSPYTMSLDIDIGDREAADTMAFDGDHFATTAGTNAGLAALVTNGVTYNIGVQISVPVSLLTKALDQKAIPLSANSWLWSYEFENQNVTWTANLTGTRLNDTSHSWSMSVTRSPLKVDGCCSNFVLFSGVSATLGGSGNWQIFDASRSDTPAELYQVIFSHEAKDERTLTFTVNSDRPTTERFGRGSVVTYTVTPTEFTLVVDDSAAVGLHTMQVNRDDKSGRYVQASGAESCWGTLASGQANITCP